MRSLFTHRVNERDLDDTLWRALVASLCAAKAVVQQGPWLHLPAHTVELRADEQALATRLLASLDAAGFDPPWVRELARRIAALAAVGVEEKAAAPIRPVSAAVFRDATGLGRKREIQLLEFFDRIRWCGRASNPVGGVSRFLVSSTLAAFRPLLVRRFFCSRFSLSSTVF